MKRALGMHKKYFDLIGFRVVAEKQEKSLAPSEATIMLKVGDTDRAHGGLRQRPGQRPRRRAPEGPLQVLPVLRTMTLVDYKVRALSTREGTGTVIRVLIESSDGVRTWETVGVSENIIEASWQALVDSIDYKLLLEEEKGMKRLLNIRDATKELNILRSLDSYEKPFELLGTYRLIDDGHRPEATVSIKADHGEMHEAATGVGPVDALASVLKKSLASIFPLSGR